jgi:hypothetical protein
VAFRMDSLSLTTDLLTDHSTVPITALFMIHFSGQPTPLYINQ